MIEIQHRRVFGFGIVQEIVVTNGWHFEGRTAPKDFVVESLLAFGWRMRERGAMLVEPRDIESRLRAGAWNGVGPVNVDGGFREIDFGW